IVIEAGEVLITSDHDLEGSYAAGASLLIPANVPVELTVAGPEASFLQLSIASEGAAASRLEAPVPPVVLLSGPARLPRGEATLSIIELTVAPGVDAGQRVFSGPMGIAVESGLLTVVDLDGQATRLKAGGGFIAPAYTAHQIRNDGPDPVRGIAVGVLPASPGLAGAPLATPTPAQDLAATATFEAMVQSATDLQATVTAGEETAIGLNATIAALDSTAAGAVGDARATAAAIGAGAIDLAAGLATSTTRSFEAEATAVSLRTTIVVAESAADSRAASSLATVEALAAMLATRESDVATLASNASGASASAEAAGNAATAAEATIAAQAMVLQTVIATATSRALQDQAIQGTLAADLAVAEDAVVAEQTLAAELADVRATVSAQASTIAELEVAPPPSIDANFAPVTIDRDLFNLAGDPNLRDQVIADIRGQLQSEIDRGCDAGLVLTFGHIPEGSVGLGIEVAGAVNALLVDDIPDVFGNAVTEDFVIFEEPFGSADLRVYFTSECDPNTATAVPTSPTSPPIVPSG
ncbi:MAG: cupin domain-containing protein, partial [Chloroflexota bacterium]|nr:cupin domain-containing protein [Chloroflexota bacterium]